MRVRKRSLPRGWYPDTAEQTAREIGEIRRSARETDRVARAGILPHAGWQFSGRLAFEVLSSLTRGIDTIVIIGGHMDSADRIVAAFEDAFDTPLGAIKADAQMLDALRARLDIEEDRARDNTVEVQLPFVRDLAPNAMVLWMRAPPSSPADELGMAIAEAAAGLDRRVSVAGSTDLTHYGGNYGFSPAGAGAEALRWVREVNDGRIVQSMLAMDIDMSLKRAAAERSACSIGGAVAAMRFARETGARQGTLVGYMTSYDVHPAESFVGYAGIVYS